MNYENISTDILEQSDWAMRNFKLLTHVSFGLVSELRNYESRGRFAYRPDRNDPHVKMRVWFELEKDAVYFALKYTQ